MTRGNSARIKLTKEQLLDALCKACMHPEKPENSCNVRREGDFCRKCIAVGRMTCEMTSLENKTIFEES